ncbi:hypothetical protein [Labilibaculum euxinus]
METNNFENIENFILEECAAMVKYLAGEGLLMPSDVTKLMNQNLENGKSLKLENKEILELHNHLSAKVYPAQPKAISLLYREAQKKSLFRLFGPVGLIRRLMLTTILSLACFIIVGLSPSVNSDSVLKGILDDHGWELLLNIIFFLSAAALGACFSNLFQANKYIIQGNYDPKYESSYWIRFVLGLIAGLMLAILFPDLVTLETQQNSDIRFFTVPLIAMLGGFSASLFYRIMNRMVVTVETLLVGQTSKEEDGKTSEIKKKEQSVIDKKQIVEELLSLKSQVKEGDVDGKISKTIDNILMN